MENRKYKVFRDNIYVGQLIKANKIYRYDGYNPPLDIKAGTILSEEKQIIRTILFVPDEKKLANDLLYNSPSYPILNITPDETCLKLGESSFVLSYNTNLSPILKFLGFNEELTYQDILVIRKTLFNDHWVLDNCELFGYKEDIPKNWKKLKKLLGYREFSKFTNSHPLDDKYFFVLDDLGDPTVKDIRFGNYHSFDPFIPHKQEGPIKKLNRF